MDKRKKKYLLYQNAMSNLGAALRETILEEELGTANDLLRECRIFASRMDSIIRGLDIKANERSVILREIKNHKIKFTAALKREGEL